MAHGRVIQCSEQMLNVFHCVLDLNDGAAIYGRQVRRIRLRKAFEVFEESRVLREDTPMNAKLRVLSLQHNTSVSVPDRGARYRRVFVALAFRRT
jgi:hypothetical protein